MSVQVIHGDIDFRELQDFFLGIGMDGSQISFSPHPADSEDRVEILIQKYRNWLALRVPQLGLLAKSSPKDLASTVRDLAISCSGHKKSTLRGLTVRDSQGKKFKPEIDIYAPRDLLVELPDALEYVRHPAKKQGLLKRRVYFCSEILSDLLDSTSLSFEARNEFYELTVEEGVPYMHYSASAPTLSIDFLTHYTVSQSLLDIIGLRSGTLPSYLRSIISLKSTSRPKSLFRSLEKHKKEMEYALRVVEGAPKFHDARDDALRELKEFLATHHTEVVGKYEYLEVVRQVVPRDRSKFSLGNFLDP